MTITPCSSLSAIYTHNMPFKVTGEDVYAAILSADALGRLYKA